MLQQTNAQYQQANRELESKFFIMYVWYGLNFTLLL